MCIIKKGLVCCCTYRRGRVARVTKNQEGPDSINDVLRNWRHHNQAKKVRTEYVPLYPSKIDMCGGLPPAEVHVTHIFILCSV